MKFYFPKFTIFIITFTLVLSGCSAFRSGTEVVSFYSDTPNTYVTVNGDPYKIPAQVTVPRNATVKYEMTSEGFKPANGSINNHISGAGKADLLGACIFLLPVLGIISPGFYSLNRNEVNLSLIPEANNIE